MEKVAFIYEETFIYWHSVVLILGVLTTVFLFLAFWLDRGGKWGTGAVTVALGIVLSMFLARTVHWYSMSASYAGAKAALTDYSTGGYALLGAFAGCVLTACLLRLIRAETRLLKMLDCMALAGAAGIAVGRLSDLFTSADLGMQLTGIQTLPFAYPVQDALTGETTYRLATFMLQSIAAGVIFAILLGLYLLNRYGKYELPEGDIVLLFLLLYCPSQAVLDSTRYDSLFFRGNGFVSIVQVACTAAMVLSMAVFSVRMVRKQGFKLYYIPIWIMSAGMLGGAGYMEYFVQRYGHRAAFGYTMMSLFLLLAVLLTILVRRFAKTGKWPVIKTA